MCIFNKVTSRNVSLVTFAYFKVNLKWEMTVIDKRKKILLQTYLLFVEN